MLQEKKFYITYTFCITWFIIHDTFVMAEQQKNRNKTLFIVENGYDPKLPVSTQAQCIRLTTYILVHKSKNSS